jgi:hypothetical protein
LTVPSIESHVLGSKLNRSELRLPERLTVSWPTRAGSAD